MRDYIIFLIRDSHTWNSCIDNGVMGTEENPAPNLESLSDKDLVAMYDYYVHHIL